MRFYYILIRIANIKRLTIPNLGKYVDQLEYPCIVSDCVKQYNYSGNSFAVSYIINHIYYMWQTQMDHSDFPPGKLPGPSCKECVSSSALCNELP